MADSNGNATAEETSIIKEAGEEKKTLKGEKMEITSSDEKIIPKTEEKNGDEKKSLKVQNVEVTDLDEKIIRQIEYYFGDINLARDKFLQEQVKLDDGWVPLDVMLTFNRLKKLSKEVDVIVNALGKSSNDLMEISEDQKKIRRSPNLPLPIHNEERRKEILTRSVYTKGFPATGFSMDDALAYFSKYGDLESVQLRNYKDKATSTFIFKGSAYVVFKSLDDAKAFVDLESVKHEDVEITKQWLAVHAEEKRVKYAEKRNSSKQDRKKPGSQEVVKESILTKGAVLHLTGFSGDIARENIKKDLTALGGNVQFVDFNKGDTEGWVRLDKEGSAKELLDKMEDGKFEMSGVKLDVKVLEGEEEDAYLAKSLEAKKNRWESRGNRGGRGRGRGRGRGNFRGGRGGHRAEKRKGSPSRGESSAKRQAV